MEKLPIWRLVSEKQVHGDAYQGMQTDQFLVVEYDPQTGAPRRKVATVSRVYRFVSPVTWISSIIESASKKMSGDISIMSVTVGASNILVEMKLPSQFTLVNDSDDGFGLTMVAFNSYNAAKSALLGLGAIRFACTNGCIFGDHSAVTLMHRGAQGDPHSLDRYLHPLIDEAAPKAQAYLRRMQGIKFELAYPTLHHGSTAWRARQWLQEGSDAALGVLSMHASFSLSVLLAEAIMRYVQDSGETQGAHTATATMYQLYNICTSVASHELAAAPRMNNVAKTRNDMLHRINKAFDVEGAFARPAQGEQRARLLQDILDTHKHDWWSFDCASAQAQIPANKRKRGAVPLRDE